MAVVFKPLFVALFFLTLAVVNAYVDVQGDGLYYKGKKVFLSGANYAWNNYGQDFGDNHYFSGSQGTYERWLEEIANAGGNAVRFWLHVEGYLTPVFDGDGFVTSGDKENTLGNELHAFLEAAQSHNIFVIPTLWNGAYLTNQNAINLVWDENKLKSYLDNALIPLVKAVSNHPALAAWEIVNEPEGSIRPDEHTDNPCFDTSFISGSGAGWTGVSIPMENYLKFINWQIDAIRSVDPEATATQGAWSERSQTNACSGCHNYFTDECLIAAGKKDKGTIDFYQIHTYAPEGGSYSDYSPFKVSASAYGLDKPVVIGEFASSCSGGMNVKDLYQWAYQQGYSGAWSWQWNAGGGCADSAQVQGEGISHIRGMENEGNGWIGVEIN